mgnify:CR=1 FL=1
MKYYYIVIKLKTNEAIYKAKKNNRLFDDFQKRQEIINNLRQKYLHKEGEKYTFFPVINNYFIKFKNKNISNLNNISNIDNSYNNKFAITEYDNKRFEKNKKIKRVRISRNKSKNNKDNYFLNNFLSTKKSTPNILIKNKTEENIIKTKVKNMTLKDLIQEEKIKDKKINKNIKNKISHKNVNKIISTIFSDTNKSDYKNNNKNINRIKTESSFVLTNDESSNNITDKTNFKLQSDISSIFDNINYSMKKYNDKNNSLFNNKTSIDIKNNDNIKMKIVSVDINKPKIIKNKKIVIYKKVFNNKNNYNKTEYNNSPKEKNKKISIIPYNKIRIDNKQIFIKKRNLNELKEIQKNNRYKINYNKTQINEDTTQTSDYNELKEKNKEIYKNISFEIKEKHKLEEKENESDNVSIQSLRDSKIFEIAKSYIDDGVDKNKINEILTYKKLQNQNFFYDK